MHSIYWCRWISLSSFFVKDEVSDRRQGLHPGENLQRIISQKEARISDNLSVDAVLTSHNQIIIHYLLFKYKYLDFTTAPSFLFENQPYSITFAELFTHWWPRGRSQVGTSWVEEWIKLLVINSIHLSKMMIRIAWWWRTYQVSKCKFNFQIWL